MRILIRGAFIYSSDAAETCLPNGSILIRDSRIERIATMGELDGQDVDLAIDGRGLVALPGFINCHTHATLTASRADSDDLELFPWLLDAGRVRPPHPDDALHSAYLGCTEMLLGGITYAVECGRRHPLLYAAVARELGQRCMSGGMANSEELRPGTGNWPELVSDTRHALAELPEDSDGLTRYFIGAHSPYSCTPERLVEAKRAADDLGLAFNVHLAECRDEWRLIRERHGRTPLQHAASLGILDSRSILNHCVWLDELDIEVLSRSGAAVAHCPISNAKLASGVAPISTMRAAGIPVGLGTDSTVSNNTLNAYEEMKFSLLVQRATSLSARQLTARDALAMATREAAKLVGMADEIGTLESGKRADLQLVALSHPRGLTLERVRSDLVWATRPEQVRWVLVNGDVVVRDGQLVRADQGQLADRARRHFAQQEALILGQR
ncbi:MAG: amidohydrolase [Chloroflexota bacterium]